ncbi:MAG: hypothetical protein AVDCRST_MAG64-4139 [uncultured Phycisphaerae bacterium]|uniref:Uncharacterized protein n=1 Tax=uncultured Phycisphaerae bacterium TaxID=904963 RepID=A0A6J4QBM3_9BACT|nr:MAG: hypothetical protein AVDCRST_MAG64-4139 [uncultured Phycisphaerae bacterium]
MSEKSAKAVAVERTSIRRQVQEMLRAEDKVSFSGSLGLFLRGLGYCAAAGFLVATVLWLALGTFHEQAYIGWTGWFAAYWVVLVGVLVVRSRAGEKERKGYKVGALSDDDDTPGGHAAGDLEARTPFFSQVMAWGPRALVDGFAGLRGKPSRRQNDMFKRAAQILSYLAKYSSGVPIKGLMRPPENIPVFTAALDWLEANDYTGRSSDGERMWITTIGRKKLTDHNIQIKITEV